MGLNQVYRRGARGLLGLVLLVAASSAHSKMLWSNFSLSYLHGSDYELGDPERNVLTVEHASGHTWGDNFFFMDHLRSDDGTVSNYFELSPRLSLGYLTGKDLSFGIVKDVLIASTWEGGDFFDNYLYGLAVNLDLPGFKYFSINVYKAFNGEWDDDEQLTITWGVPFNLGPTEWLFDGFMDTSTSTDTNEAETNLTFQLKWNIGAYIDSSAPFYVGMEYAHWTNKFGVDGADERNPCLLIKWHF